MGTASRIIGLSRGGSSGKALHKLVTKAVSFVCMIKYKGWCIVNTDIYNDNDEANNNCNNKKQQ